MVSVWKREGSADALPSLSGTNALCWPAASCSPTDSLRSTIWGQVCLPCHGRWPAQGIRMSIRALGAAQRSAISMSSILTLRAPEMKSSAD